MRDKLNNNPAAQIGLVVVLLIAAGYLLLGGGGEGEEAAPTEATVTVAGTGATGTATGATPGEAVEGAVEAAGAELSATQIGTAMPVPPLPHPVSAAYDSGKTVVLLVVHPGGIDDRLSQQSAEQLRGVPDVSLFVIPARLISHYAAITLGANVEQVPALVVMRPKSLSGGVPRASVDYGFRTAQSVVQAVLDASYEGPEATYHPG